MSADDEQAAGPVRVRSGLTLPLPPGWEVIDTLDARSPDGVRLTAASFPVDPGVDLALLVAADVVRDAEPIGAPESARIFGERAGLVQRFDSTIADEGFSQLAGYALAGDRLFVVRATCARGQFEQLEPSMRASLKTVGIEHAAAAAPSRRTPEAGARTLDRFLAGEALCALPERLTLERATASNAWDLDAPSRPASSTGTEMVLTTAELSAIAHLYGQPAFPGTRRPDPSTASSVADTGRSVLLARGLVRFASPEELEVDDAVQLLVVVAFQADVIVHVEVRGPDPMRSAYFAGGRGSLRVTHHEGDIHVCSPIANDDLFADLTAAVGDMSDDGDGPALLADRGAIDATMVRRQLSLRRAAADSDRIDLDHLSMVSIRGEGCYAADDSGSWSRVSPPEQRRRLLDALNG